MGTWNTKREELEFTCGELEKRGHVAIRLDLSTERMSVDRDEVIAETIKRARNDLAIVSGERPVGGALAFGGGTNLFMAIKVMDAIPVMIPKVIVSTMIANSLTAIASHKDILYIQSPCDFGNLNPFTRSILRNAVNVLTALQPGLPSLDRPAIAVTAMGLTPGYTDAICPFWDGLGYDIVPFHAAGESTMAMSEFVRQKCFEGVLDLSIHDVMDHQAQGEFGRIDRQRLQPCFAMDIPAVITPGGLDAISFHANGAMPIRFKKRKVYRHDYRWVVKATKEEVRRAARWIGEIFAETRPRRTLFLLPSGGWSSLGERGGPFEDRSLQLAFRKELSWFVPDEQLMDVDMAINDPRFGLAASRELYRLINPGAKDSAS